MLMESGFLPHSAVLEITKRLSLRSPQIFDEKRVSVVGLDIPPSLIIDRNRNVVESKNGAWFLPPGAYQVGFGFDLGKVFVGSGIEPRMFWRTSNQRCGAGGSVFFNINPDKEEAEATRNSPFGQQVCANYYVYNPHGIMIERDAALAQLCFAVPEPDLIVSELLKPAKVEKFAGPGMIGRKKTTLPAKTSVPFENGSWQLDLNVPYFVEFAGLVQLGADEVFTLSRRIADMNALPKILSFFQYTALGDPGFRGKMGMLFVPLLKNVFLTLNDGFTRIAKHKVINHGDSSAVYRGQWQGQANDTQERLLEFRHISNWPELQNVVGLNLNDQLISKI